MSSRAIFIETLESRQLLSSSALAADLATLKVDRENLAADKQSIAQTLAQDRADIKKFHSKEDPGLAPLIATLHADITEGFVLVVAKRAIVAKDIKKDAAIITQDKAALQKVRASKTLTPEVKAVQIAAYEQKIPADIAAHAVFVKNEKADELSFDAANAAKIASDRQAIADRRSSAGDSPEAVAAQQKLADDLATLPLAITLDTDIVAADLQRIADDKKPVTQPLVPLSGVFKGDVTIKGPLGITLATDATTLTITNQTSSLISGSIAVPDLGVNESGDFAGDITPSGNFNYKKSTDGKIVDLQGHESTDGRHLTGQIFYTAADGTKVSGSFDLTRQG